jgi:hypothetical protein
MLKPVAVNVVQSSQPLSREKWGLLRSTGSIELWGKQWSGWGLSRDGARPLLGHPRRQPAGLVALESNVNDVAVHPFHIIIITSHWRRWLVVAGITGRGSHWTPTQSNQSAFMWSPDLRSVQRFGWVGELSRGAP